MTLWALALAFSVLSTSIVAARQSSPQTMLLVRPKGQDAFCDRVRAELDALGWLVVEATDEGSRDAEMEALATRLHAVAVIRVSEDGRHVELWVRPPNGVPFRETVVVAGSLGAEEAALHTVEGLRARFVKLGVATTRGSEGVAVEPSSSSPAQEAPSSSEEPSTAPEKKRAAAVAKARSEEPLDAEPVVWASAGPAVSGSPGGFGFNPHALMGIRLSPSERWRAGGLALLPVSSRTIEAAEGRSTALWGLVGADAQYSLTRKGALSGFAVGTGLTFVIVHMEGEANPPFEARKDSVVAAAPVLEVAGHYRLSRALRLRADLVTGIAVPRPVVRFAGRTVASWGRPFGILGLALEFGAP